MRKAGGRYSTTEFRAADGFVFTHRNGFMQVSHNQETTSMLYGPGQWWGEGTAIETESKKR